MPWNCGVLLWGASPAGEDLWGASVGKGPTFRTLLIKQVKEKNHLALFAGGGAREWLLCNKFTLGTLVQEPSGLDSPTHCGPFPLHH